MTPCCQSGGSRLSSHSRFFFLSEWFRVGLLLLFFYFFTHACLSRKPLSITVSLFFLATPPPPVSSDRISTFPTSTSLRAFNCLASRGKWGRRDPKAQPSIRSLHLIPAPSLLFRCWRLCPLGLAGATVIRQSANTIATQSADWQLDGLPAATSHILSQRVSDGRAIVSRRRQFTDHGKLFFGKN